VLQKALELNHRVIVCINKIDKPDARIGEVEDEILELLMDLGANDEQLDSPMLYCSGRSGTAVVDPCDEGVDLTPLFEKIVIPGQLNNDHLEKLEGFTIDVQGHAIQALGFDNADEAWAAFDAQTEAESGVVTP
jgi:predicted membrane GTPase involved in stress response